MTNLTMGDIEDLDSVILVKVHRDQSPFWESFTWRFAESTSDNLGSVEDSTNTYYGNFKYQKYYKGSRNYCCFKI
jgi:hypothetical protein